MIKPENPESGKGSAGKVASRALAEYGFPVQYVEIVEQFLVKRGRDARKILTAAGIEPSEKLYESGVITGEQLYTLFSVCLRESDPNLPLSTQLLAQFPVTAHGLLGIVVMTSPTLQEALGAALKFYPLVMPAYSIQQREVRDQLHLVFEPLVAFGTLTEAITEMIIGAFNSIQRYVAPNHIMLEVHFKHHNAFPLEAYQNFSDASRLYFDQPENKLVLPKANLHFPISTANKVTMQQFEKELEKQIVRFRRQLSFRDRVAEYLHNRIADKESVSIELAASALCLSARTLSRKLSAEGASFSDLVTQTRIDVAAELLRNTNKTVGQVAAFVGFASDSSFCRAFKKVLGVSPTEFRSSE